MYDWYKVFKGPASHADDAMGEACMQYVRAILLLLRTAYHHY